jgi:hypothetical protein
MMRRFMAAALAGGLMAGSLLVGTSSAQVSLPLLPSLTPELLLDIARVPAPAPGMGLQVHADFPSENPLLLDGLAIYSLTADITPDGSILTRNVITQAATAGGSGPAKVGECDDPTFLPTGVTWAADAMPILWRFDRRSTPEEIKADKTLLTVRSAHRVWPQAQSDCADRDHYSFAYNYLGHTAKNPKYDGTNMVDFGDLGQGALAVNSTWYTSSNRIVEVDLRLNKADYAWTNLEGVNRYQVRNVIAHELGHQVGLDDLGAPHQGLTMFGEIGRGELNKVTLGRGDLKGAATIAP